MLRKTISKFLILFLSFTLLFAPTYSDAKVFSRVVTFVVVKKLLPHLIINAGKKGGQHATKVVLKFIKDDLTKDKKNKKDVVKFIKDFAKENPAYAKNAASLEKTLTDKVVIPNLAKIKMRLPDKGTWSGPVGNSRYWPKSVNNKSVYTDADLHKIVGKDGIIFKNGYPNFDRFRKGNVKVEDMTGEHRTDVSKAAQALADRGDFKNKTAAIEHARKNDLAWHHEPDGTSMSLVPNIIHQNVIHDGGAAFLRATINAAK